MKTKLCGSCGKRRLTKFFAVRNKTTGLLQAWCRDCRKSYDQERYRTGTEQERLNRKAAHAKERNQRLMFEHLSAHTCVDCGEADIMVLEFDHVRGEKLFNLTDGVRNGTSKKRLLEEIDKCEVRCCNCHRRKTLMGSVRARYKQGLVFNS